MSDETGEDPFWDGACACGGEGFAYNTSLKRWWCRECWRRERPEGTPEQIQAQFERIRANRLAAGLRS